MFMDLLALEDSPNLEADICIVGAGPAGISMARSFLGTSIDVLVLESGGFEYDSEAVCRCQAEVSSATRRLMRLDRMETKAISMKATRCSLVRSKIEFNRR